MNSFLRKYSIVKELGKGGFSTIYLAKQNRTGNTFAAKHLNKKGSAANNNPLDDAPWQTEVEVARRLTQETHAHPNIIQIEEILEDENDVFIVQQYVAGGTLKEFLRCKPTEFQVRRVFFSLLSAVEYLHSLGVVHRDIKLENVLMYRKSAVPVIGSGVDFLDDLQPKLIDFNLSCFWSKSMVHNRTCGTLLYIAPEVYSRLPYHGPEVDVWSLGVLLYKLLFGVFPFRPSPVTPRDPKYLPKERRRSLLRKVTRLQYEIPPSFQVIAGDSEQNLSCTLEFDNFVTMEAVELLRTIFVLNPRERPTILDLKRHPWFTLSQPALQNPRGQKDKQKNLNENEGTESDLNLEGLTFSSLSLSIREVLSPREDRDEVPDFPPSHCNTPCKCQFCSSAREELQLEECHKNTKHRKLSREDRIKSSKEVRLRKETKTDKDRRASDDTSTRKPNPLMSEGRPRSNSLFKLKTKVRLLLKGVV